MIDLETGNARGKLKEIEELLKYRRRANPIILSIEEKKKHNHLHHFEGIIRSKKSNKDIGKFGVIFFKKSLEISCGINKKEDSEEDKIKKIEKFILENEIISFFSDII